MLKIWKAVETGLKRSRCSVRTPMYNSVFLYLFVLLYSTFPNQYVSAALA